MPKTIDGYLRITITEQYKFTSVTYLNNKKIQCIPWITPENRRQVFLTDKYNKSLFSGLIICQYTNNRKSNWIILIITRANAAVEMCSVLSVCVGLSVCPVRANVWKPWPRNFVFGT